MKTLVAYFSAQGTTAALAKALAEKVGADLFEIRPVTPYTAADIRWTNPLARCNREKIGKKDVPVAGAVADWESYDLVYLGFPIWYYGAPNVVNTFCKGYNWEAGGALRHRRRQRHRPHRGEAPALHARGQDPEGPGPEGRGGPGRAA